jgi:tagatose 6-phosphate kinase
VLVVVALNPALDVTHHVHGVDWNGVNRPSAVRATPGGKGLNVARTLHALGADVRLVGLAGGPTGATLREGLRAWGVQAELTQIAGATRRTFAVVDSLRDTTALFNEPGPQISRDEYDRFRAAYVDALAGCTAVVLSGSLPSGLPPSTYADLTMLAAEAGGVPTLLDTSGAALLHGATAGPAMVKPNLAELAAVVGSDFQGLESASDTATLVAAAASLRERGPGAVVISLGADGLLAVTGEGSWLARPQPVAGNPTGAGDAAVAGLAHGVVLGRPWAERLRHAAALGAAAAAAPAAGEFCRSDYDQALAAVSVTSLEVG